MSNKKTKKSLIGAVICALISAFFLLMAMSPLGPGDALVPMFALLWAFLFAIGFFVFLLIWAVKKLKD